MGLMKKLYQEMEIAVAGMERRNGEESEKYFMQGFHLGWYRALRKVREAREMKGKGRK